MQLRNKPLFIAASLLSALAMSACGNQQTSKAVTLTTGNGGGNGSGNNGSGGVPTSSPLTVTVGVAWETDLSNVQTMQTCVVPAGIEPGAAGSNVVCTAYVPEAQLYYSQLSLTMATDSADDCALMLYNPYYYVMSRSANFVDYNSPSSPVDCSVTPTPVNCYNGPAVLTTDFPAFVGTYYLTAQGLVSTNTIPSANSRHATSNTWTANNLDPAQYTNSLTLGAGDGYVANTFHDYTFGCLDKWGQAHYSITLTISDDPTLSGFLPPPTYSPSQERAQWYLFP